MNRVVSLCLFTLVATGSACVKLPGLSTSGGSSGGSPGGGSLLGDGNAGRTTDLYKRFTYLNVTSSDATELFSSQGIPTTFNPKNKMKNLDPAWIPGWDSLELTDEVKTAILQAAVNRTWQAQVDKDYKRYRAAWAAIDKDLRPKLDQAAALPNYYARGAALAQLLDEVKKRATADKVFYDRGDLAYVGFTNDVVRAMVELHKSAKTEFLLDAYLKKASVHLGDLKANGRGFAADDVERDLFTQYTRKLGNEDTGMLPVLREYGNAFKAVAWPVARERVAAADKVRAAMLAETAAALAPATKLAPLTPLFGGGRGDPADPKLRWIAASGEYKPLTVAKVTPKSDGAVVELESSYDRSIPYDCKETNQVDTTGSGRMFVQACKYRHEITKHLLKVTFAALPEGVALQMGDEVELYGDLESKQEAKLKVSYEITARALASAKRGGKPVASYW